MLAPIEHQRFHQVLRHRVLLMIPLCQLLASLCVSWKQASLITHHMAIAQ